MNRKEIEEKDQHLIKKIREIIKDKEKNTEITKPGRQSYRFWVPVLCAGVIVAGLFILKEPPPPVVSDNSKPAVKALEQLTPPASQSAILPEKATAPQKTEQKLPEVPLIIERPAETKGEAQSPPAEQSPMPADIQIYEMVSCSSVNNKHYVSAKTVFSLKQESTPVVWMNVLTDRPPFTLTHVYYVNGRRYCEVPLEIRYRRMRTWSNVTLNNHNHTGEWRVEVVTENGDKLGQIEFTVVE